MTPAALQTLWARLLVEALARSGVTRIVLSPGSRSTPLAFAALGCEGLVTHTVVDERSAGFFALGLAKAGVAPVALLCSSGSAMAHYFPALIEAAQCGVPLVVLSADRPPELQHTACPQTIDQVKLFGGFVRFQAALGPPEARVDTFQLATRLVAQAVARSLAPLPGPTHLNIPLRKPLEPETAAMGVDSEADRYVAVALRDFVFPTPSPAVASDSALRRIAASIRAKPSGLIVLGPGLCPQEVEPELVRELACASGLPVLAETASGARLSHGLDGVPLLCDAVDHVLAQVALAPCGPLVVLQLGAPLVSGAYPRLLDEVSALELHVLSSGDWPDPSGRASTVVSATLGDSVHRLTEELRHPGAAVGAARRDWEARLRRHNWSWWTAVDAVLGTAATSRLPFGEPEAVRAVLAALPGGSVLAIGNSLPVREVDWFSPARARDIRVFSQRGANGIDGAVSSASGVAAALGRTTVALLGDLTFLHDLGGLAVAARAHVPLVFVVLNNGGGRIFEHLPLGELAGLPGRLESGWIQPQKLDLGALASGFGLCFARVDSAAGIASALADAFNHAAATVIELVIAPHSARDTLAAVRRTVGEIEG